MIVSSTFMVDTFLSDLWDLSINSVSEVHVVIETWLDWEPLCLICLCTFVDTVERDFEVRLCFDPHVSNFLHSPTASAFKMKRNMKKPCRELKIVKRSWEMFRSSMTVKRRMAKSQVSPKRNMTPEILNIIRKIVLVLTFSCF